MQLFVRADADSRIGTGHVMRCIALAQAWQDRGGRVTFLSHCESQGLRERILSEGFDFHFLEKAYPDLSDLGQTLSLVTAQKSETDQIEPRWLVLDGYHFSSEYQKTIHDAGISLLVVDDMNHLPYYHADIILNQNIDAQELRYHCDDHTILLLGTRYVLLRREFLKYLDFQRQIPQHARNILVTLGGADPDNVTLKVIEALKLLKDAEIEVKVIVGPANPHRAILTEALSSTCYPATLLTNPPDIPELMAWADLGICGGGSTCWEFGFMGLPSIVIVLAENQVRLAASLERQQHAVNVGWHEKFPVERLSCEIGKLVNDRNVRKCMSANASTVAYGKGRFHVMKAMGGSCIELRRATYDDCSLVWKWANDRETRKASFSQEPILWDEHVRWFEGHLRDPAPLFFIATDNENKPLGQIRYAVKDNEAIVSFSMAPEYRNRGYGSELLRLAALKLFRETGVTEIIAFVKVENSISLRAFRNAGFVKVEEMLVEGAKSDKLLLRKAGNS